MSNPINNHTGHENKEARITYLDENASYNNNNANNKSKAETSH